MKTFSILISKSDFTEEMWDDLVMSIAMIGLSKPGLLYRPFAYGVACINIVGPPGDVSSILFHLAAIPEISEQSWNNEKAKLEELRNTIIAGIKQTFK